MSHQKIKAATCVREIQDYLESLYPNQDASIDYLYGYAARTVGYLCKNISLNKATPEHFIRPISWIFSIGSKLGIDIEESYAKRFPNSCPYCLVSTCICFKTKKMPASYIPAHKVKEELSWKYRAYSGSVNKITLDECAKNINGIYPSNEIVWHYAGPWHHFVKMQEEVSEIHEAISRYAAGTKPLEAVADEIADTLAWMFGAWVIVFPDRPLDDSFIDYYIHECPVCGKHPCSCEPRSDRVAELVNIEELQNISDALSNLLTLIPAEKTQIEELQKSIGAAMDSQNEPVAVQAVKQTKMGLDALKKGISNADEIGRKSNSLIASILSIVDKLSG